VRTWTVFLADSKNLQAGSNKSTRPPRSKPGNHHKFGLKKALTLQTLALELHQNSWGALETRLVRSDGCWTTGLASQNPTSLSPAPSEPFRNGTAQFFVHCLPGDWISQVAANLAHGDETGFPGASCCQACPRVEP